MVDRDPGLGGAKPIPGQANRKVEFRFEVAV